MLRTLDHVPAFILGRRTAVVASNHPARSYLPDPGARRRVGDLHSPTSPSRSPETPTGPCASTPSNLVPTRPGADPAEQLDRLAELPGTSGLIGRPHPAAYCAHGTHRGLPRRAEAR
ncbi:hypothetical protein [Streptomyces sp. NPDC101165]|uniref:hypothetical protein n=1 Tax=Streptomyces sp. NPDC101165 TaxID=3366119 RepID=UPI003805715F